MGLRSPQEMQTVKTRQEGTARYGGAVAPQLSTEFAGVLESKAKSDMALALEAQKKKQQQQQQQAEDLAKIRFDNEVERDIVLPAMAEVANSQGIKSHDVAAKKRQWMRDAIDKKLNLQPEQYKQLLAGVAEKKFTRFEKTAVPKVYGEYQKIVEEEHKTHIANRINESIEGSGDHNELIAGLSSVSEAIIKRSQTMGRTRDQMIMDVQTGESETVRRSIEQQAALGNLQHAKETLSLFNEKLSTKDRVKALALIDKHETDMGNSIASGIADKAMTMHPDDINAQYQFIKDNSGGNDKTLRAASAFHKSALRVKTLADDAAETKAVNSVMKELNSNKPLDPEMLNGIKSEEKRNQIIDIINKNGGMANRLTDKATYASLVKQMFNDPEKFKTTDLSKFEIMLSPNDYKFMQKGQQEFLERDMKRQEKIDYSTDKLIKDVADENITALLNTGKVKDADVPGLYLTMMEAQQRLLAQGKGLKESDIRRVFAERVQKYKMIENEKDTFNVLWTGWKIPWGVKDPRPSTYIPTFDHTEDEIEKIKTLKPEWEMEKVFKFLDSKKSKK